MDSTACERSSIEEFRRDCCIHGYHVYKEMWEAAAGEVLECMKEPHNVQGRYAVTAKKNGNNHGTKVVKSVFVLLVTRGVRHPVQWLGREDTPQICTSCWTYFVYCAQKCTCYFCTVNYRCFNKFHELNFCCSLALRKYFNNKIFPNYGRICMSCC